MSKFWRSLGRSYKSWSLLIVALLAIVFATFAWLFKAETSDTFDVAVAVFALSGAMVALALPAAGLVGQQVQRIAEYWLKQVFPPNEATGTESPQERAQKGQIELRKAQHMATLTWRGLVYVLCALFLSAIALFTPRVTLCSYNIAIDYLLLGGAFGFVLIGACLFFPSAWWILRLDTVHDIETVLESMANNLPKADSSQRSTESSSRSQDTDPQNNTNAE